ncbi:MAG: cob(I)yrinic acid a,c-diamide adenosyltransferase [Candidatus Omnitrophica bacterium]|nr:cob(I)yrinic acid a,c-diamide adenosyltransferase [Candidatus Omnitrophota bacterium]
MIKKGLVYIYTGDGKGKTTAAVGQIIRALGHNLKICYISFHKDPKKWGYGELDILRKLGVDIFCFAKEHPHFCKGISFKGLRNECKKALDFIEKEIFKKDYDLLVLDEINIALRDGYIKENKLLDLLNSKPKSLSLILTGRGMIDKIIEKADLVSEIKKIKHPFDRGLKGRRGIEF